MSDPLDGLFDDQNIIDYTAKAPAVIEALAKDAPTIVEMSGDRTALVSGDDIADTIIPLNARFLDLHKANNRLTVTLRKEILLKIYEAGAARDQLPKIRQIKDPHPDATHSLKAAERRWSLDDPKFAAHLAMAKVKNNAIIARRTDLGKFLLSGNHKPGELKAYQLGVIVPYDRDVANIICDMLAEGKTIISISKNLEIPMNMIQRWRKQVPEFGDAYTEARRLSAEIRVDEAFAIIDEIDPDEVAKGKAQSDLRMKYAALVDRDTFGSKTKVEVETTVNHEVTLNKARRNMEKMRADLTEKVTASSSNPTPVTIDNEDIPDA